MEDIIERDILTLLIKHLDDSKILAIRGARQTGKSTVLDFLETALKKKGVSKEQITFLTFEDPQLLDDFVKDPRVFLSSYMNNGGTHYFLLDEVQYDKQAGKHLKLVFDTIENIKIIITGSSSLEISQISKFLVGRIYIYELYGLNFGEYLKYKNARLFNIYKENRKILQNLFAGKNQPNKFNDMALKEINKELNAYIIYGSYPEIVKCQKTDSKIETIKNIYTTYIGKDVISLLGITDSSAFRKVLLLLSLQIGSLLNYNELANDSQTYYKQAIRYINALEETYVAKIIRPFHKNLRTELRKNPKIYLLDTGLRNYIINNFNELDKREDTGHLVENFVFNQLNMAIQPNQQLNFWRTLSKAEVDFIFFTGKNIMPIEVKFSNIKKTEITKGMRSFIEKYSPKIAIVLTKNFIGKRRVGKTTIYFAPVAYI